MADRRIIVVGGDEARRIDIATVARTAGLDHVTSRASLTLLGDEPEIPALLVVVGDEVPHLVAEAREVPVLAGVPILAVVPSIPSDAASSAIGAGADDVVLTPPSPSVFGARCRSLLRAGSDHDTARELGGYFEALEALHLLTVKGVDTPDTLREALILSADVMGFDRASLIAHIGGADHCYVVAATDDPALARHTLAIVDYPEIDRVISVGAPVFIDDVHDHPLMEPVARHLDDVELGALAVYPVSWKGRPLGAVSFKRVATGLVHFDDRKRSFGRMVAAHFAAQLRRGKVMETLRDQTHRISRARYEAERRLRTIESLKEHFEAASDGVIVIDGEGHILFVNRTAEDITGFARDGLMGSSLVDLIPDHQRDGLLEVVSSVLKGQNLEAFDLDISTTSGEPICVSVTTSTVLSSSGAVILQFRDVTRQRLLEIELRKTKEFLERLIDSTVDAIVAADLRGNVILFNQGAERIYGYSADEVIGKIPVWRLYPDDVPKQVMRMLRSTSYGGVGRLEQTRREVLNRDGEGVPVNMTASIIYEDGREVATVGIFSDLRERIRIEQRLLRAQEKLQMTEKQAVVAELAGATAHELNQPLTSIIGYAQLIERQSDADAQHMRAVGVILREAERMAEIVKKIGRITKYETTEYVGSANILDIDASTSSSPDLPVFTPGGAHDFGDYGEDSDAVEESSTDSLGGEPTRVHRKYPGDRDELTSEDDSDDEMSEDPHTIDDVELGEVLSQDEDSDANGDDRADEDNEESDEQVV